MTISKRACRESQLGQVQKEVDCNFQADEEPLGAISYGQSAVV